MPTDDARRAPPASVDEDPNVEFREYSSPPCLAHELAPAWRGPLAHDELVALLHALLRDGRQRARAIALVLRDDDRAARRDQRWQALARDQRRCVRLMCAALRRLGARPDAQGAFVTVDLPGQVGDEALLRWLGERLAIALKCWRDTLPRISDDAVYEIGKQVMRICEHSCEACVLTRC